MGRLQPRLTLAGAAERLHARPLTSTDVRHAGKRWHVQFSSMDDGDLSPLLLVVFDRTGLRFWDHANAFAPPAANGSDRDAIGRQALAWYRDWRRTNADVRAPTIERRFRQDRPGTGVRPDHPLYSYSLSVSQYLNLADR